MNICIFIGRLTKDPEVRYTQSGKCVARFTLAVDRKFKREGEATADFLNFVSFGGQAEFIEKYVHKGTKLAVQAHCQNDNYQNREGNTVYRDSFYTDSIEFAESKAASQQNNGGDGNSKPTSGRGNRRTQSTASSSSDEFINIPNGIDEEMPFN